MSAQYLVPTGIDEALSLMASRSVSVVAGGTDYFPAQQRLPVRKDILDITRIPDLAGIQRLADGSVRIGATTSWTEIIRAELPPCFTALKQAAREVGSVQIQNAGTVGGNICNASPAADGIPPLLILDAEVEISGAAEARRLPLESFVTAVRQTALQPGELLSALHIPAQPEGAASAFQKLGARRYLVISIAMTAALIALDSNGRIAGARVAVGSCSAVAQRLRALEADLVGQQVDKVQISASHLAPLSPISDVRADAGYRSEAAAEQVQRAIVQAAGSCGASARG
ncbi:MAG: FAD binding domain-containing protein [Pseudomonadota bacterium]